MKIVIVGAGNVGGVLGTRWADLGHEVIFAVRDPHSKKIGDLLSAAGNNAKAVGVEQAAKHADVIVLATPWLGIEAVLAKLGDLENKIIIDCTNPLKNDLSGLLLGPDTSAAEKISGWAKGARVVKAFNTTGSQNMADPFFGSEKITMFLCGDDENAKKIVSTLAEELDFEAIDAGGISAARYLETMAMFWIHLAFVQNMGRDIGVKLLKR